MSGALLIRIAEAIDVLQLSGGRQLCLRKRIKEFIRGVGKNINPDLIAAISD